MKKFAVIDIGSNSVRLMFVADGKVLYKRLHTTRLGEGLAEAPRLKTEAIERSALAVSDFYTQAKTAGAEEIVAFATAAVRTAENRAEFLDRVNSLCGLTVEVVSGEEEAELGILGALGKKDGGVIDVGGASTEIVVKQAGALAYKKSVDIGVVRLKDKCGRDTNALQSVANEAASKYDGFPRIKELHAIGGTATTLAALELGLTQYSSEKVTGTVITDLRMRELADKLSGMSVAEISALPCMPKGRADVITGGAVLLSVLMQRLNIQKLIVSDKDNLEGYAIKKGWMQ